MATITNNKGQFDLHATLKHFDERIHKLEELAHHVVHVEEEPKEEPKVEKKANHKK